MKKRFYLTLCILCAFSFSLFAQAEITVEPGDDLIEAIAGAADGDVIIIKPGVHIANFDEVTQENANIEIDGKSLTIKGEEGAERPVIYLRSIDLFGEIESLTFQGLEVSGLPVDPETLEEDADAVGEDLVGSYFVNMTSDLISIGTLTIKDCVVRNLHRAVIRGDRAEHDVEKIVVDDCIIHDIRDGSNYGVFRLQSNLSMETFLLTNSTIYDVLIGIIQSENTPEEYPETVTVENCTFYNIGGGAVPRYLFDFKLATNLNFTMQHNILGKTNEIGLEDDVDIQGWRFNFDGQTSARMVANNLAPDFLVIQNSEVYQGGYEDIAWASDQFNLFEDPGFADPDNADFTLPEDSPLLMASLEGEIIGDPRWNPVQTSVSNNQMAQMIGVYPNPANGLVTIQLDSPGLITIYSALGAKVREIYISDTSSQIDISDLNVGIYLIKANRSNNATKLVITR